MRMPLVVMVRWAIGVRSMDRDLMSHYRPGGQGALGDGELLKGAAFVVDPRTMVNGGLARRLTGALLAGAVISTVLLLAAPSTGATTGSRKVSAWLPYWDSRGNQTVVDNADLLA